MSEVKDLNIRVFAFGRPSPKSAYLSVTVENGDTYRLHFTSKRQISMMRSYSSQVEDQWTDD